MMEEGQFNKCADFCKILVEFHDAALAQTGNEIRPLLGVARPAKLPMDIFWINGWPQGSSSKIHKNWV